MFTIGSIISVCLIVLGQFIVLRFGNMENLDSVSGLYGPGAVGAWLLAYGNTLFLHFKDDTADDISNLDIAGFIGTACYPVIAAFDVFLHLGHRTRLPQYYAALSVCHLAIFASAPLVCPINRRKNGKLRRLWSLVLGFSIFPIILDLFYSWPQFLWNQLSPFIVTTKLTFNIIVLTFLPVLSEFGNEDGKAAIITLICFVFAIWLIPMFYPILTEDSFYRDMLHRLVVGRIDGVHPSIQFIFPRTASSLRDLDQAVPFGAALITLIFLIISKTQRGRYVLGRLLGREPDEGIEWEMVQPQRSSNQSTDSV
jgi:hypothetical protein